MMGRRLQTGLAALIQVGVDAADSHDVRLQKMLLVAIAIMIIPAALLWGLIYVGFGEALAGSIPLFYAVFSTCSIIIFHRTRSFRFFRASQLLLMLLLPFLLMLALGGFINSSGVILWSFFCPLGALIFSTPRDASRWFLIYIGLVVGSGFLQAYVRTSNNLSPTVIIFFFVMNIGTISAIAFALLYYFVTQKDTAFRLLHSEQQKAENLLLNILPKEIAAILKNQSSTIADHFDGVSILFADIVNFTPLSATMTPVQVVELLNEVFSYFDLLVDKYDLEKIKTIGDAYMVAAGIPRPRSDHAHILARMALDMCAFNYERPDSQKLQFRIGINSGSVVAGVIGRKKFIYDLWGDAVNTASRMESHGSAGRIQITRATYELLKDDFICEPRGTITIKGKGEMEVWYLEGEKTA
jgi:guanylate cyclase